MHKRISLLDRFPQLSFAAHDIPFCICLPCNESDADVHTQGCLLLEWKPVKLLDSAYISILPLSLTVLLTAQRGRDITESQVGQLTDAHRVCLSTLAELMKERQEMSKRLQVDLE